MVFQVNDLAGVMNKSNHPIQGLAEISLRPHHFPYRRGESSNLFLFSPFRLCGGETLTKAFQVRVECHPYCQQQDGHSWDGIYIIRPLPVRFWQFYFSYRPIAKQTTSMETDRSLSFECLQILSCFMFVCSHCERIRYDKNAEAPCERNPNVIADRLSGEQGTYRIDDGGDRLVFGKSTDN